MANERTTGQPLAATVGERLGEKAREGDSAGIERAQAAVDDLRSSGWEARGAEAQPRERQAGEPWSGEGQARQREGSAAPAQPHARTARGRGSGIGWAVAAGLGAWVLAGMIGRAFRR